MVSRFLIALIFLAASAEADPLDVAAGKALFNRHWIAAPSSTRADEGLGPLYDARSCSSCHMDAHAGTVAPNAVGAGMLVRLGQKDGTADPIYGRQLQQSAVGAVKPESRLRLNWIDHDGLRAPSLTFSDLSYGPLRAHAGLRRAPDLFGVGALAAIPDREILRQAAREAREGIAGHPAWIVDGKNRRIGRWGWKASAADLSTQTSLALMRDIGLSTAAYPLAWGECSFTETGCRSAAFATDHHVEVPESIRSAIVAYLNSLEAPRPTPHDRGWMIFERTGCAACHSNLNDANGQRVFAMSDLLLHDLGPGLDDGIAEGSARPSEWRTAPLWHLRDELARGGLLHDGRARSIAEAVAWHGKQASSSRMRFAKLSPTDRKALENFLLER